MLPASMVTGKGSWALPFVLVVIPRKACGGGLVTTMAVQEAPTA